MKTLILNADFSPLSVVSYRRGVSLLLKNKLSVISWYDNYINSENARIRVPAVILYSKYISRSNSKRPSKKAILKRDDMTCQYCGVKLNESTATIDHVKPVCKFKHKNDANTWTNMVACCKKCNHKKGNKLLYETEMRLLNEPVEVHPIIGAASCAPREWLDFIRKKK
jgi:5-methylcytosine-specific restriction endonuclease McrA